MKSNRLFSYLKQHLPFSLKKIVPIGKDVFRVEAEDFQFVLKSYSSLNRLKLQEAFTRSLKQHHFDKTYFFHSFGQNQPLFFDHKYFGCLEYIPQNENRFLYHTQDQALEGLWLLKEFHNTTAQFLEDYTNDLPAYNLVEKFTMRTAIFQRNSSLISFFLPANVMTSLLSWSNWSLQGMKTESYNRNKENVILHGDVAYHNFIRNKDEELYLIDFDLISIGQREADYLQYANRILPYFNWSLKELEEIDLYRELLQDNYFLYALSFPSDIFREWNRLIRERKYNDPKSVRPVLELTLSQFQMRELFIEEIKDRLTKKGKTAPF